MKFISSTLVIFLSVACSSNQNHSKISTLEVSEKLVKGKTTQAQVLENFGSPDVVEKTPEGDTWGYTRHSSESDSVGGGISHYISSAALWNFTGMGLGGDKTTSATKTASLILYFDKAKKLKNYSFRTERF